MSTAVKWTRVGIGRYLHESTDGSRIKITQTGYHRWDVLVQYRGKISYPVPSGTTLAQAKRFVSEYLEADA